MSKLLKCPFCGGEAREYKHRFSFHGEAVDMACCDKCGFSLVKSVWNTRTPMDNIVEKLKKFAKSKICDNHKYGCLYRDNDNILCENCGALGAINIVKQEINNGLE